MQITIQERSLLIMFTIDANVVVFPDPVGPVTSTKPEGLRAKSMTTCGRPNSSKEGPERKHAGGGLVRLFRLMALGFAKAELKLTNRNRDLLIAAGENQAEKSIEREFSRLANIIKRAK